MDQASGNVDGPTSRPVRYTIAPRTAIMAATSVLIVFGVWNAVVAARSVIATTVAALVVAILVSGPVEALDRKLPRPLAIIATLLLLAGAVGTVGWAAFDDLDQAFARLQVDAPDAARALEESDRFGDVATDLQLEDRVTAAVDRLRTNTQDRAQRTALRFVNYFVAGILAIFLLVYGPRIFQGALGLVDDGQRRARISRITFRALEESRTYLGLEIVNGIVVGTLAFGAFRLLDLPGAAALALVVGLGSAIPDVGILTSSIPALLLIAASESFRVLVAMTIGIVVVQAADSLFSHRRLVKTVDVGPAVSLLSVLLGFAIYGIGGAIFGFAIAVFVSSVIDAVGREIDGELEPRSESADERVSDSG